MPRVCETSHMQDQASLCTSYVRSGFNGACKRGFDILLAVIGLIIAAPTMGLISILLWLESPGHVIFTQTRIGLHGHRFRMHKFRKFPADWGEKGPAVTVACDSRMTFIGAILEKLKFDELPQLWNILKGEMSFVGPRPESPQFGDMFEGRHANLLNYVPGIFGPNQIAFRNESAMYPPDESPESFYRSVLFPKKAEADLEYFSKATWLTDIVWIIRGVWTSAAGAVNWRRLFKLHAPLIAADVLSVLVAWVLAHVLRFSGWPGSEAYSEVLFLGAYVLPVITILVMYLGGCYQQPARYLSLSDSLRLIICATIAWLISFLIILAIHRAASVYLVPMSWFILLPLLILPRVLIRLKWEKEQGGDVSAPKKIAIYGAGRIGNAMAGWMFNDGMVGFIDDDPELKGRRISGYFVLGHESDIPTIHEVYRFHELWVSFVPESHKRNRLNEICRQKNIRLIIIPELEPFSSMTKCVRPLV